MDAGNDGTTGPDAHAAPAPAQAGNGAAHDAAGLNGATPPAAAPAAAAEAGATLNAAAEAAGAGTEPAAKSAGKFMEMLKSKKGMAIAAAVVAVGAVLAVKHFRGKEEGAARA